MKVFGDELSGSELSFGLRSGVLRILDTLGIDNIVVNPADVPTMSKEKQLKTDAVDSGKLDREL